jgi:hypothetical protein
MQTTAAVYFDEDLRVAANQAGTNYWHVYTREICQQMGLMFEELPRSRLSAADLAAFRVLILPDLPDKYLKPEEKATLAAWVQQGGLLIGFATGGLGDLFGITVQEEWPQPDDAFTPTAVLRYMDTALARSVMFPGDEDMPVVIVSPVKLLTATAPHPCPSPSGAERLAPSGEGSGEDPAREVARLLSLRGRNLDRPAITLREVGEGQAVYFCFNVAQSMWALHHGRPIEDDYDGDGKLRSSDGMVAWPHTTRVPYADTLLYLLRNLIARRGLPFLHALPPTPAGAIPDCLFHYGGDDEGQPANQLIASAIMRDLGLGYHVNIMPDPAGTFAVTRAEYDQLKANGHEPSLHLNFIDGVAHPYKFSRREVQQQVDWYVAAFGELPVCTVFHWTTWHGWSEVAEWLAGAGVKADNSRFIEYCPPPNPVNTVGFGFGTALPFFHYSDWRKDNDRIRFLAMPIGGYEVGYLRDEVQFHTLRQAIDMARFWHLPFNLFYHPIYVAQYPACRAAIREGLAYLARLGLQVMHWGNDRATLWWLARSEARLTAAEHGVAVRCAWEDGCIVQMLCEHEEPRVMVDGQPATWLMREEYGGRWLYVAVPAGEHTLSVE